MKPSDAYVKFFTTQTFATGAATDADSLPAATAYKNGTSDAVAFPLTVANVTTGVYKITGTVPAGYVAGDQVSVIVTATVDSVAGAAEVDKFLIAFPLTAADSGATQITRVGSQPGMTSQTYTVTSSTTGLPLQGVLVKMCSDAPGSNVLDSGYTDASGNVTLYHNLATGTALYMFSFKNGYTFSNPDTETAS